MQTNQSTLDAKLNAQDFKELKSIIEQQSDISDKIDEGFKYICQKSNGWSTWKQEEFKQLVENFVEILTEALGLNDLTNLHTADDIQNRQLALQKIGIKVIECLSEENLLQKSWFFAFAGSYNYLAVSAIVEKIIIDKIVKVGSVAVEKIHDQSSRLHDMSDRLYQQKLEIDRHNETIAGHEHSTRLQAILIDRLPSFINSFQQQDRQIVQQTTIIQQLHGTIHFKDETLEQQNQQIQEKDNTIQQQGAEIQQKNEKIIRNAVQIIQKHIRLRKQAQLLKQKDEEIKNLSGIADEIKTVKKEIAEQSAMYQEALSLHEEKITKNLHNALKDLGESLGSEVFNKIMFHFMQLQQPMMQLKDSQIQQEKADSIHSESECEKIGSWTHQVEQNQEIVNSSKTSLIGGSNTIN